MQGRQVGNINFKKPFVAPELRRQDLRFSMWTQWAAGGNKKVASNRSARRILRGGGVVHYSWYEIQILWLRETVREGGRLRFMTGIMAP